MIPSGLLPRFSPSHDFCPGPRCQGETGSSELISFLGGPLKWTGYCTNFKELAPQVLSIQNVLVNQFPGAEVLPLFANTL